MAMDTASVLAELEKIGVGCPIEGIMVTQPDPPDELASIDREMVQQILSRLGDLRGVAENLLSEIDEISSHVASLVPPEAEDSNEQSDPTENPEDSPAVQQAREKGPPGVVGGGVE